MTLEFADPGQTPTMLAPLPDGDGGGSSVPSRTILHAMMFPSTNELKLLELYARTAFASRAYSSFDNYEKAMLVALKSWHLGIDIIEGFAQIVYISGKMTIQAQLMIALANRSRLLSSFKIPNPEDALREQRATVICVRVDRPEDKYEGSFSMADAEKAGLTKKPGPWQSYPGAMLVNRAVSLTLRRAIPEVLGGMYITEELEEEPQREQQPPRPDHRKRLPASEASPAPNSDETVIEPDAPWHADKSKVDALVTFAIEKGYMEAGQKASDLLKLIGKDDFSSFPTGKDAAKTIQAEGERLKAEAAAKSPLVPTIVPPVPPSVAEAAQPSEPAPVAPVVDDTIYEVNVTSATYNGKSIVFDSINKHGVLIMWSRGDLVKMLKKHGKEGDDFAQRWQVATWAGSADMPGKYRFDALILGYQITPNKAPTVVSAKPDEIPF